VYTFFELQRNKVHENNAFGNCMYSELEYTFPLLLDMISTTISTYGISCCLKTSNVLQILTSRFGVGRFEFHFSANMRKTPTWIQLPGNKLSHWTTCLLLIKGKQVVIQV